MSLLTRSIEKIVRIAPDWVERVVRGTERAVTPREFMKTGNIKVPPRINKAEEAYAVKTKEQPPYISFSIQPYSRGQLDHFRVSDNSDSSSASPNGTFNIFDISVLDTKHTDSFNLEVIFETIDGQEIKKTKKYEAGSFFSARYVPVRFSIKEPAERVEFSLESQGSSPRLREYLFKLIHRSDWKKSPDPCMTIPTLRSKGGTPIVIISVDTFRYDHLHTFEPVLTELGSSATVPNEPRTQGYCTQPSHGSLFTGVHPTVHGNFGSKPVETGHSTGINSELQTIPELLDRNQYKCSGCGSEQKIGPINGFGDGMDRFRHYPISWDDRVFDASDIANAVINWIHADVTSQSDRLFYFLHFFDPHYPYIPPQPEEIERGLDYELVDQVREQTSQKNYLHVLNNQNGVDLSEDDIRVLKQNYEASLEYTAFQIQRVIQELKRVDLFDQSFIIITGDHGEEFFERKFWGHSTLYDANIRPGMILKPPQDSSMTVRDNIDLMDIFPTIAKLVEDEVPEACQGVPLQSSRSRPRVTERHGPTYYNVAVEKGDTKGIFTYNYQFPGRPTSDQVADGPKKSEFYFLPHIRSHKGSGTVEENVREELQTLAKEFILDTNKSEYDMSQPVQQDVEARLEKLGYK